MGQTYKLELKLTHQGFHILHQQVHILLPFPAHTASDKVNTHGKERHLHLFQSSDTSFNLYLLY